MKRIILTSVLLLMGAAEESMAACVNDVPACYTQVTNLTSLLPGKTVCNGSSGNWNGQEWHSGSSGQAKNLETVFLYVKQLDDQPMLSQVYLQKHSIEEADVSKPVNFTILAKWQMSLEKLSNE